MNRWAYKPTTKTLALLAAAALALAPVDLLAICCCGACGCAAAAEDSPDCCCGHAQNCDYAVTAAKGCCQPAAVPTPDGCSCSKSVPASPVGTLPVKSNAQDQQAPAIPLALLPPVAEIDSALYPALTQGQPLWPVPVRILLCVWRN